MRKITANVIYPVSSAPLKNAYLIIDDKGKIVDIVKYERNKKELAGLEYYSGILIPGFVNPHCNLALLQLNEKITNGHGLNLYSNQGQSNEPKTIGDKHTQKALRFMWSRGISALGNVVGTNYLMHQLWTGSDSYALSNQVSVIDAMVTISIEFPEMSFETLLEMVTLNGAKALGMEETLGSFDKGKQPGVLLVSGFDFKKQQLRSDAEVTRMV